MSTHIKRVLLPLFFIGAVTGSFFYGMVYGEDNRDQADRVSRLFGRENEARIPNIDFAPLLDAWYLIDEKYVFSDAPDDQEKLWGTISGLVESIGDPYSVFMPPKEAKIFQDDIRGNFGGIGIEIGMRDGVLAVISPLKNTPAYRAGLVAGDKIIEIDGEPTTNIAIDDAVNKIRGERGTKVILTLFRENEKLPGGGETIDVPIVRDTIVIPTIDTEKKDGAFIISLYSFSSNSVQLFANALSEFEQTGGDKLVIDLRNNPGGFLDAAIEIASLFLPKGTPVVIEDVGKEDEERIHRSTGETTLSRTPKIVVLVNKGSASASEILAAALAENKVATLVGEKTFGKGSVQELVPLTSDTFIKITVARWLTPERHSLSDEGITPEVVVERTSEDIVAGKDPQLEKAIEILNK